MKEEDLIKCANTIYSHFKIFIKDFATESARVHCLNPQSNKPSILLEVKTFVETIFKDDKYHILLSKLEKDPKRAKTKKHLIEINNLLNRREDSEILQILSNEFSEIDEVRLSGYTRLIITSVSRVLENLIDKNTDKLSLQQQRDLINSELDARNLDQLLSFDNDQYESQEVKEEKSIPHNSLQKVQNKFSEKISSKDKTNNKNPITI